MKRPRRLNHKTVTLVILVGACIAGWLWWEGEERQYREDTAALRALGIPTDANELRVLSRGSGANDADFYRQANQLWDDIPPEESQYLWLPKPNLKPEEHTRVLEKHKAAEESIVAYLRKAASSDYADFELPWENPIQQKSFCTCTYICACWNEDSTTSLALATWKGHSLNSLR